MKIAFGCFYGALTLSLSLSSIACFAPIAGADTPLAEADTPPLDTAPAETRPPDPQLTDSRRAAALPSAAEMQAAGAVIGEIVIINGDVFDTNLPEEDKRLFRLANKLHIETRPDTVRAQLLFSEGDRYSAALLRESERILRANTYLFDARIVPVAYRDGVVDVEVRTRDVWTLKPGISFSREGGKNESGFEFEESNLLGLGKEIELSHESDVDRNSTLLSYRDPHLFGGWNRLKVAYGSNSDGKLREFSLDRPFYSLHTRWAGGGGIIDWQRIDSRYNLGEVVDKFSHDEQDIAVSGGWSVPLRNNRWSSQPLPGEPVSGQWVRRISVGAAYQRNRFGAIPGADSAAVLPQDRELLYPFVGIELLEDAFEERRNQDQIERTEDFYAGKSLRLGIGYAAEAFGSDRNAVLLWLTAGNTFEFDAQRRHTLVLDAEGGTRMEGADLRNAQLTAGGRYYWRLSERQLFYALLSGTVSDHLDAEEQILLGGDNGLRGYPLRYQDGTSRALMTLEHRYYTKYYLFRLFNIGGAVFFDMGRTWGRGNAGGVSQGLLRDVGIGLRLGSSRSAFGNVIHIDLAMPLDGDESIDSLQFLVGTKRSF